jgi:hypothetical protein
MHTRRTEKRRSPAGTNCEQFEPRHTAGPIRVYEIAFSDVNPAMETSSVLQD